MNRLYTVPTSIERYLTDRSARPKHADVVALLQANKFAWWLFWFAVRYANWRARQGRPLHVSASEGQDTYYARFDVALHTAHKAQQRRYQRASGSERARVLLGAVLLEHLIEQEETTCSQP
jgi:ABC-type hemin transport system ATPase subunit